MSRVPLKMLALGFVAVSVAGSVLSAESHQTQRYASHVWKRYNNVRFQYSICYPEDLLIPQGESENGDGERFRAKDGAQLIVYGQNNALDEQLIDALAETESRLRGRSGTVTYKLLKSNWFVVTGQSGPTLFYAKTMYSHGQFKSFELTYYRSSAAVYNALIRRLNTCFIDLAR